MSKQISVKMPAFTLDDLRAWLEECAGAGIPGDTRYKSKITWSGYGKEMEASTTFGPGQHTHEEELKFGVDAYERNIGVEGYAAGQP